MLVPALALALLLALLWTQSPMIRRGGWRLFAGLGSVILTVIGIVLAIRGEWWIGLPLVLLAMGTAGGARVHRRPSASRPPPPPVGGMSAADARSILGVQADASVADIRAAYTRLMQRAHPDKGGSAGLAAQLNAARDRLLKG